MWVGGERNSINQQQAYLLQEGVGAAHEPLRLLHLRPHVGDALHAPDTGRRGTYAAAAEQPALALEDEAAQLA